MSQMVWTFPGGKILDNYTINLAGSGDGFNVDNQTHRFTVPSGKRWLFHFGVFKPDTNAAVTAKLYNENDKNIGVLSDIAASTALGMFPEYNTANQINEGDCPFLMKAGWYIEIVFGALQSTAAYVTCQVEELDA